MKLVAVWDAAGLRAKFARANENLDAFADELARYVASDPYGITTEFDVESGWHILKVRQIIAPGERFGVLIGEAAHNLRSALNHIAWQLANLDGPPPDPKGVQWPILSTRPTQPFAQRREVNGMRGEHITVLEGLQPYNAPQGGPTALTALADINNVDKHRLVHTVATLADELAPQALVAYQGYRIQSASFASGRVVLEGGAEIGRVLIVPRNSDPQMYMQSALSVSVAFGEPASPYYGFGADGLLRNIAKSVELAIGVFDRPGRNGQAPWP